MNSNFKDYNCCLTCFRGIRALFKEKKMEILGLVKIYE
jgi:hypothetical protein